MNVLTRDIRFAWRILMRDPGLTLIIVLTLGLGIGANSAIFGLLDAALLRPPAVRDPARLEFLQQSTSDGDFDGSFGYANYADYRDRTTSFTGLAAYGIAAVTLRTPEQAERVWGVQASGNYFGVLGAPIEVGRGLAADDDRPAAAPVVVLSHRLWKSRFGSDRNLVGQTVQLNGVAFSVVGVAAREFHGLDRGYMPDVWLPIHRMMDLDHDPERLVARNMRWLAVVGRLSPGVATSQATAQMNVIAHAVAVEHPQPHPDPGAPVAPTLQLASAAAGDASLMRETTRFGTLLFGVTALVLLIACANVANLLLARASERGREIAIRLALGGGRSRIVRQLLSESLLLGLLGGVAGCLMAVWSIDALAHFRPPSIVPLDLDVRLDWRVIGFTAAVSILTSVAFGLAPALKASRPELWVALKDTQAGNPRRSRLRGVLVVTQVALSMAVLVGAALLLRSLDRQRHIDLGYDPRGVVAAAMEVGEDRAKTPAFFLELIARVRALPGVRDVAVAQYVPPTPGGNTMSGRRNEFGLTGDQELQFGSSLVSADYFRTLRMPIVRGRGFAPDGSAGAASGIVINEVMARTLWPGEDPIGRSFLPQADPEHPATVLGVVRDGPNRSLRAAPMPFLYQPLGDGPARNMSLIVRSDGATSGVVGAVRRVVTSLDPNVPLYDVRTLEAQLATALMAARLSAYLTSAFGVLALLLASLGLYGVLAYSVTRRRREIGVRMALGAPPSDVLRQFVGEGVRLAVLGLAAGLALALLLTRFVTSLLYQVSPTDPGTYVTVAAVLLGVATLACWIPARRASRTNPAGVLRAE